MKKMLIIFMIVIGISIVGEIVIPRIITQTFYLIDSAPANPPVTAPHWLIERWVPRYNVGLVLVLGIIAVYFAFAKKGEKKMRKLLILLICLSLVGVWTCTSYAEQGPAKSGASQRFVEGPAKGGVAERIVQGPAQSGASNRA